MKTILLFSYILFFSFNSFSQINESYQKHTVLKGENVVQIAKKYKVSPYDIYKLNPSSKQGIKEGEILLINLILSEKIDLKSKIDSTSTTTILIDKYIVKEQETLYGLSKKFKVTQEDLLQWNPIIIEKGLKEGQLILINNPNKSPQKNTLKISNQLAKDTVKFKEYKILPGETLYGISKKFNVSQIEILELNTFLKDGFKEGLVIKLPDFLNEKGEQILNKKKLEIKANNQEKTLVIFLPFNISKIESDSLKTINDYLKTDKTLNITLDFYAGQLLAIDSLKKLGYNLKVKIFDTESSVNKINEIISSNDFSKVDAVIGPFFNNQIEQTALLLKKYNTPVISPLSSKTGKAMDNIYYSRPSDQIQREELMKYFKQNNGNVLAIFNQKKIAIKEELSAQYPELKVVPLLEKGELSLSNVELLLDVNKKNFVILETESTQMTLSTINILLKLKSKYKIQLVVLELYPVLDFEAIKMKSLTDLELLYPTNNRKNESNNYISFAKKFKSINNLYPNSFATRGFDLTLDTVLRMYQEEGFKASTSEYYSEQLESKFNYIKIENGNFNNAIYLHQYMDDLTIKQIK